MNYCKYRLMSTGQDAASGSPLERWGSHCLAFRVLGVPGCTAPPPNLLLLLLEEGWLELSLGSTFRSLQRGAGLGGPAGGGAGDRTGIYFSRPDKDSILFF